MNQILNASYRYTDDPRRGYSGTSPQARNGFAEIAIDGQPPYTVKVDAEGRWSWTPPADWTPGEHIVSVRMIDAAGNIGDPAQFIQVVDYTAPDAPRLLNMYDDQGDITGSFDAGRMTDDRRPTLTGVAEKGTVVYLKEGDTVIGSAQADAKTGIWTLEPDADLSDGTHQLTLVAVETFNGKLREGEPSEPFELLIGRDGSAATVISHAVDDAGPVTGSLLSGALTDDATPQLHGSAPAGSTVFVQYRNASGEWVDGGAAQMDGTRWSWTPPAELEAGSWEFRAGQEGSWSDSFTLDIAFAGSDALHATLTHATDDFGPVTGTLLSGALTDDTTPTLSGRGEANSTVVVRYGAFGEFTHSAVVTVGADSNWSFTPPALEYGVWSFAAQAQGDSQWSDTFELVLMPGGQHTPEILRVYDDVALYIGEVSNGGITNDRQPELSGVAEANSVLNVYDGSTLIGSVQVGSDGNWRFITPELSDDSHSLSVSYGAYDAGLPAYSIVVDATPPGEVEINALAPLGLTLSDVVEAGQQGLFIDDGKTQLRVSGQAGDSVQLSDILPEGEAVSGWTQQAGTVTIAGTQYHVFSHGDAELLVQDGVKIELV